MVDSDNAVPYDLIFRDARVEGDGKHGLDEALSIADDGAVAVLAVGADAFDG